MYSMLPPPSFLCAENYPALLRQCPKMPPKLNIIGTIPSDEHKFLCVIGPRHHSMYGQEVCNHLIHGLAGYPIVIVSGLAIGIDSLAHRAALEVGLPTISFPGSGLHEDVIYPQAHRGLAEDIVRYGGALLSPFDAEHPSTLWTFAVRNRLMAGISHATLIIEAGKKSGTLLTANYALDEFSRDVFCVPGDIFSPLSYGPHMLLRRGAALIGSAADILEEFGFGPQRQEETPHEMSSVERKLFSAAEIAVYEKLRFGARDSSSLARELELSSEQLIRAMSVLELRGYVQEKQGAYRIVRSKK